MCKENRRFVKTMSRKVRGLLALIMVLTLLIPAGLGKMDSAIAASSTGPGMAAHALTCLLYTSVRNLVCEDDVFGVSRACIGNGNGITEILPGGSNSLTSTFANT